MFCDHCGEPFALYRNTQRFCSPQCYNKYYYAKNKQGSLVKSPEYKMYHNARERSKQSGLEFKIEMSDISIPKYCPIMGVELCTKTRHAPSLDRKDNSKGYTRDNIQVISSLANIMKRDATSEELRKFGEWAIKQ